MKNFFIMLAVVAMVFSCNNGKKNVEKDSPAKDSTTVVSDAHNAKNSLDYAGTYEGITPCADCEGIKMVVTLTQEGDYTLETSYITTKEAPAPEKQSGKFTWDKDGKVITLEGVKDQPSKFFVGEGKITALDQEGKKIEGDLADKYVLSKVAV